MCVIIDANVAHEVAAVPAHVDARPILQWISNKKGRIAIGGKLAEELYKTKIRRWILELLRNGSAIQYPKEKMVLEQARLAAIGICASDDTHVVALANISGARILYTRDDSLRKDFKNIKLLRPKGKIYSSCRNKNLLDQCPPCKSP